MNMVYSAVAFVEAKALTGSRFGLAPDFVPAVAIECTGSEPSLLECSVDDARSCSSGEGASIICIEPCSNEWKGKWSCALTGLGRLCAILHGVIPMPVSSASS